MKSDLDFYRRFTLSDFTVNTKKFKDYVIINI